MRLEVKNLIVAGISFAMLGLTANHVQAQGAPVTFTISATVLKQTSFTATNGIVATTAAPSKSTLNNKTLLQFLAQAESSEGNFPSNTFPSGAKLIYYQFFNGSDFQVVDSHANLLVDVSDLIDFELAGTNDLYSGSYNIQTLLATPNVSSVYIATFSFDDTKVPGGYNTKFYMKGLMKVTQSDSKPNSKTGGYTDTITGKLSSGLGEGKVEGRSVVVTGTATTSSKEVLLAP